MGHLQATGSEISDDDRSERTVIGGVEGISPDALMRRLFIRLWGIFIVRNECPGERMYVIQELLFLCLSPKKVTEAVW